MPATRPHEAGAPEAGTSKPHTGHHEHQHDEASHPPGVGGTAHPDCTVCHAAAALPACNLAADTTRVNSASPPFMFIALPAPPARAPDRPNWRFA